jgi:hypothetical protein
MHKISNYDSDLVLRMQLMFIKVCVGNLQSESDLFLYTKNIKNERLKPILEYKITF